MAKTRDGSSKRRDLLETLYQQGVLSVSDEYCIKHEVFNSKIAANSGTVNL